MTLAASCGTPQTADAGRSTCSKIDQPPESGSGLFSRMALTALSAPGSPRVPLWNAGTTTVGSCRSGLSGDPTASATGTTAARRTPLGGQASNEWITGASVTIERNSGVAGDTRSGESPPIAPLRAARPSRPTTPHPSLPGGG